MKQLSLFISSAGRYAPVLLVAFAVLAAGGCGDDGDAGSGAAEGTQAGGSPADDAGSDGREGGGEDDAGEAQDRPQAAFIEQADAVCERIDRQTGREIDEKLEADISGPREERRVQEEALRDVMVPRLEERIRSLRALEGPPSAEEALGTVIRSYEQMLAGATNGLSSFERTSDRILAKVNRAANRGGFEDCDGYLG